MTNEQGYRPQENVLMMFNRMLRLAATEEQESLRRSVETLILDMKQAYLEIQPVDAVEVVRCKDCKHLNRGSGNPSVGHLCVCHSCARKGHERYLYVDDNDFCSCGERKADAEE